MAGVGMKNNSTKIFLLLLLVVAGYVGYKKFGYKAMEYVPEGLKPGFSHHENIVYDTDPKNDRFIKGKLNPKQMRMLDKVLDEEERNGGMRLSGGQVRELACDEKLVMEAYDRWRRCCNLMRSEYRVVYPSERAK
jgi:hypothetical protein